MYKQIILSLILFINIVNCISVFTPHYNKLLGIINNINVNKLTSDDKTKLKNLFEHVPILLFKNQTITPEKHFEICKIFDDEYNHDILHPFNETSIPNVPQIALRGNCDINQLYGLKNINFKKTPNRENNYMWHQDLVGSGKYNPPKVVSIYMLKTPKIGDETIFASMEQAYNNLDEKLKKEIDNVNVIHIDSKKRLFTSEYDYSGLFRYDKKEIYNDDVISIKPLVKLQNNNNKTLIISPERFYRFDKYDKFQSYNLYRKILANIIEPNNIIILEWENNDLLIFNNRKLLHTASPTKMYEGKDRLFTLCLLGTNSSI